jgi:hypothetical protein
MKTRTVRLLIAPVAGAAAIALWGCTTARMAVPSALRATPGLPAEGRNTLSFNEAFRFGPYEVEEVHRGWGRKTTVGIMAYQWGTARQKYRFVLRTPAGGRWTAHCATGVRRKDLEMTGFLGGQLDVSLESDVLFSCELHPPQGEAWRLVMEQGTADQVMRGVLGRGETRMDVAGTRRLEGSPIQLTEAAGYEFLESGQPVAAVQVMNQGIVWLPDALEGERRDAVAAASTALLLYRDLRD